MESYADGGKRREAECGRKQASKNEERTVNKQGKENGRVGKLRRKVNSLKAEDRARRQIMRQDERIFFFNSESKRKVFYKIKELRE